MHIPVALSNIRSAITHSRRVIFFFEREKVVADFYLLGHARKTNAYIVFA